MRKSSHEHVVIRWYDSVNHSAREEVAEKSGGGLTEIVVSSTQPIREDTPVQIAGQGYWEAGIVSACHAEGAHHTVTIRITSSPELEADHFGWDPGVLAVDEFITAEEADKILDELEDLDSGLDPNSTPRRALRNVLLATGLMRLNGVLERFCHSTHEPTSQFAVH